MFAFWKKTQAQNAVDESESSKPLISRSDALEELTAWIEWSTLHADSEVHADLEALLEALKDELKRMRKPDRKSSAAVRAAAMDVLREHNMDQNGYDVLAMCRLARQKALSHLAFLRNLSDFRASQQSSFAADQQVADTTQHPDLQALQQENAMLREKVSALTEMVDMLSRTGDPA